MKQDIWQNNAQVSLTGDKAFRKGVSNEVAERCDCDATGVFDALEAAMDQRVGHRLGWLRIDDIK